MEDIIKSILFSIGESVSIDDLCYALEIQKHKLVPILEEMIFESKDEAIQIIKIENKYQMCSNPKYFDYIQKINKNKKPKVSANLMETLALVAYKQPITKNEISKIRGVSSDYSVNKLIEYNLICEKGRKDEVGKPICFGTTEDFLKFYGLESISDLEKIN